VTSVLADSSVWVAHFRKPNKLLQALLSADQVLCRPLIVLELACHRDEFGRGLSQRLGLIEFLICSISSRVIQQPIACNSQCLSVKFAQNPSR